MVRDADEPIAVVKWLAEFDNRRENRGEKTNKSVRFCQMAKLIFEEYHYKKKNDSKSDEDASKPSTTMKIAYLEEYAQGMVGKSFVWPGIDASDEDLWNKIRFNPPKPPPPVACERCGELFSSRTKLFAHIQNTDARYEIDDKSGKKRCICVPNEKAKEKLRMETILVCLSVGYSCINPHEQLIRAWNNISRAMSDQDEISAGGPSVALTWAVPPQLSSSAIINVVTMKLPRIQVEKITMDSIPKVFNEALTSINLIGTMSNIALDEENSNAFTDNQKQMMRVHTAGVVDRPCAPERRECEKYAVFIPWTFLQTQNERTEKGEQDQESARRLVYIPRRNNPNSKKPRIQMWRRPIEETSAFEFVDASIAQRLKHGTRLMQTSAHWANYTHRRDREIEEDSNGGIKVRTSALDEPMHHYCKISINVRQPTNGYVEILVGLLIAYARAELDESSFIGALKDKNRAMEISREERGSRPYKIEDFPSDLLILIEPALTRYENKTKLKLCRSGNTNSCASESMKKSIDSSEESMLENVWNKEYLLKKWLGH